jgi:WD40 repeat protein
MELPIELVCGPIASFLDRTSINQLQLTCKSVCEYVHLQCCQSFPWPNKALFIHRNYARRLAFSTDGQWLVCCDMGGALTFWNREQGYTRVWKTDLGWLNLLNVSATHVVCGNTESKIVVMYDLQAEVCQSIFEHPKSVQKLLLVNEYLYCCLDGKKEIVIWSVEDAVTPLKIVSMDVSVKDMVPLLDRDQFAIWTSDQQVQIWNLDADSREEALPLDRGGNILALAAHKNLLAVATKKSPGIRRIYMEFWLNRIRVRQVPMYQHTHITSMRLIDEHTWVTADATRDLLMIWCKDQCKFRLAGNPMRLELTTHDKLVAWIGRGSTIWLRDVHQLDDD